MNTKRTSGGVHRRDGLVVSPLEQRAALRRAGSFLVLTFTLALAVYVPIIASARGWIGVEIPSGLSVLGVFSPAVAALALSLLKDGAEGVRTTVGRLSLRRFSRRWWLETLLLAPVLLGTSYAVYLLVGGTYQPAPALEALRGPLGVALVPVAFVLAFVLAAGEELGWRGYLLPLLQTRFGAAGASLVLGVFWFLWHVPLRFLPGDTNGGFPVVVWGVSIVATAFVYTWLFNETGGSVLAVTVFHGLLNTLGAFVALHPSVTGEPLSAYVIAGVNVVFAVVVFAAYRRTATTRPTLEREDTVSGGD